MMPVTEAAAQRVADIRGEGWRWSPSSSTQNPSGGEQDEPLRQAPGGPQTLSPSHPERR